jgi:dihydrolipoamide dehydrogenase
LQLFCFSKKFKIDNIKKIENKMNQKKIFDIVIIGAGPGGYVAAIKAASLNKKVALIEKSHLGGTCLNVGCIPSKTLISHGVFFEKVQNAQRYNINVESATFDYEKIQEKKDEIVKNLRNSLKNLLLKKNISIFQGHAKFLSPSELRIDGQDSLDIKAEKIIIATGSNPCSIAEFPTDHKKIFDSTSILELKKLPKSMAIIGGGYIGCEFASLFSQFNVKVSLIEARDSILFGSEKPIIDTLEKSFKKRGIDIFPSSKVLKIEKKEDSICICLENNQKIDSEIALIAIGRKSCVDGLDLEKANVISLNGHIEVNDKMQTNIPNIFAIGDVTGKWMTAHVASHAGMIAVENAFGADKNLNKDAIPQVTFTTPEIASVGLTSKQAKEKGFEIINASYPFMALGQAQATLETEGFVQIIADKKTKQILGAHVIGAKASFMIGEMALAITNELTIDCVMDTIHPHPTMSEAWSEVAFLANSTPLHFY